MRVFDGVRRTSAVLLTAAAAFGVVTAVRGDRDAAPSAAAAPSVAATSPSAGQATLQLVRSEPAVVAFDEVRVPTEADTEKVGELAAERAERERERAEEAEREETAGAAAPETGSEAEREREAADEAEREREAADEAEREREAADEAEREAERETAAKAEESSVDDREAPDAVALVRDPGRTDASEEEVENEAAAAREGRQRSHRKPLGRLVHADRSAASAPSAASATPLAPPSSVTGFASSTLTGGTPPDVQVAAGPTTVVTMINSSMTVHSKAGAVLQVASQFGFWTATGNITPPNNLFDPRIRYDSASGRYIATVLANSRSSASRVLVAVSATSDPLGSWYRYEFAADAGGTAWADYPQLGFSADKVAIGLNYFAVTNNAYVDSRVLVLPKSSLVAGTATTGNVAASAELIFGPTPSATTDAGVNDLYIVAAYQENLGTIDVVRLSGTALSPVFTSLYQVQGQPWTFGVSPYVAPQLGATPVRVQSADDRMESVWLRNGTVYTTHQVFLGAGATFHSIVQWWAFGIDGTRSQFGRFDSGDANVHYGFPSLMPNIRGDIVFAMTRFTSTTYPSAYLALHAFDDAAGTISWHDVGKAGDSAYTFAPLSGAITRWGDYSGVALDPTDDLTVWAASEYSGLASSQAVWVSKLVLAPETPPTGTGAGYVALQPQRLLDTRGDTTVNGAKAPMPAKTELVVPIAGRGGVPPTGATAVALNITTTVEAAPGYLTVFPSTSTRPDTSNVNYAAGVDASNAVVAALGTDGAIRLYTDQRTHVIVDVAGYFGGAATDAYRALNPARVLDTRSALGTTRTTPVPAATSIDVQVAGAGGVPATGATAVVLNVTATGTGGSGFLQVYPSDGSLPATSNVNYRLGADVPNLVISKLSADGKVRITNSQSSTHLIVDVAGWYGPGSTTGRLYPQAPVRVLDTRSGVGTSGSVARVAAGGTLELQVLGQGGVPSTAKSVLLNITVTDPQANGYLTVYPSGNALPNASNVNYRLAQSVPNLVFATVGPNGRVSIYSSAAAHVIADVQGWVS